MASKVNTKCLVKYPVNKVEYVWKIERHLLEEGVCLRSPAFSLPLDSDTQVNWKLKLLSFPVYDNCTGRGRGRPRGRPKGSRSKPRLYARTLKLFMFTSDIGRYNVDVLISFQGKHYYQKKCTMNSGRGDGEYELLANDQIFPILAGLSPQDDLFFEVKIYYFKESCLKASDNFGTHQCSSCGELHNLCAALLSDPTLSDVTLKVQGRDFRSHKVILSAVSPVFRATFQNDMLEKSENLVEIKGLDPEVVDAMIKYIYTGIVSNLDELAADLFVAADRYKLDKLQALSQRYLLEEYEISIADASKILVFADLYSIDKLKTNVVQFISDNLDEVRMTQDWKTLVEKDGNLLNLILDQVSSKKRRRNEEENN